MLRCPPLALMHARTHICDTRQVHDIDEMKQHPTKVCHGMGQSVIDDTISDWHKHL